MISSKQHLRARMGSATYQAFIAGQFAPDDGSIKPEEYVSYISDDAGVQAFPANMLPHFPVDENGVWDPAAVRCPKLAVHAYDPAEDAEGYAPLAGWSLVDAPTVYHCRVYRYDIGLTAGPAQFNPANGEWERLDVPRKNRAMLVRGGPSVVLVPVSYKELEELHLQSRIQQDKDAAHTLGLLVEKEEPDPWLRREVVDRLLAKSHHTSFRPLRHRLASEFRPRRVSQVEVALEQEGIQAVSLVLPGRFLILNDRIVV